MLPAGLRSFFKDRLLLDEPLGRHTSARIGGPADVFLVARNVDDLRQAARIAWSQGWPVFLLGGGSNILISDAGVRGLVVLNQADSIVIEDTRAIVESGASAIHLARRLAKRGLAGFEWAIGVPGTIGGAAYGNAGAHSGDMQSCVVSLQAITPNGEVTLSNAELGYQYRSSILKRDRRRCVILSAVMQFRPESPQAVHARMKDYTDYRKRTQPPGATIGSMFKNPSGDYAGRLIEAAGLKGHQIGGAQISHKHANFYLNRGDATAQDVMALAKLAQRAVEAKFGVKLELEIEPVGEW